MKTNYKKFLQSLAITLVGICALIAVKAYYPEAYDLARVLLCFVLGYSIWALMPPQDRKKFLSGSDPSKRRWLVVICLLLVFVLINVIRMNGNE